MRGKAEVVDRERGMMSHKRRMMRGQAGVVRGERGVVGRQSGVMGSKRGMMRGERGVMSCGSFRAGARLRGGARRNCRGFLDAPRLFHAGEIRIDDSQHAARERVQNHQNKLGEQTNAWWQTAELEYDSHLLRNSRTAQAICPDEQFAARRVLGKGALNFLIMNRHQNVAITGTATVLRQRVLIFLQRSSNAFRSF